MEKSIKEMIDDEVLKRCKPKVNKQENKQDTNKVNKNSPHLALCHSDNPSANNRHKSLMLKSKANEIGVVSLVKSEHKAPDDFEYFCRGMADLEVLSALYSAMSEANDETLQELIEKGKKQ